MASPLTAPTPDVVSDARIHPAPPPTPPQPPKHPSGLYVLFGAEAWERFSYYGMRALLVLYLVNHIRFPRQQALAIYGTYTGLVFLTPIAGGWLADKILGRRKAVLIGGVVMALGHLAMAFEPLLFIALGLLIVGNGFFKPNISTIVGGLYEEGDPRRDGGFTIFYMGINLGAFFSPIICGNLGERLGWHYGFSAAAVGMTFGLAVFVWGQRLLGRIGLPPGRERPDGKQGSAQLVTRDYLDVGIWIVGACALVVAVIYAWRVVGPVWGGAPWPLKTVIVLGALFTACLQLYRGNTGDESQQVTVILILCLFNIFFWMGFEQAGGTMTLFADKQTDRHLGGLGILLVGVFTLLSGANIRRTTRDEGGGQPLWIGLTVLFMTGGAAAIVYGIRALVLGQTIEIPASQFQAINPLLIVVMAPMFSKLWFRLDSGRFRTSTPTKMAVGMIILGLGFVVMFVGQKVAAAEGLVGPGWLAAVYAIHTVGELCLSPIGLSMVTKLAPARVVSLAMGLWFLSSAIANYLAGTLEGILEASHTPIYGFLVASSIGPAVLLIAITPLLKRWMHGKA